MRKYECALITGATSGIGAAFAAALPPTTGLLLPGRDPERLASTALAHQRPGRCVETMQVDLADPLAVDALAARADAFGIDLLINNAGVGPVGPFLTNTLSLERETAMVNVVATLALTRQLLPGMLQRARSGGRRAGLIIVASMASFAPVPYFASYAATKAFGLHFAVALAEELRQEPIDVVALCPGPTRTAFGLRAGFAHASVPGAADPAAVARAGLAALGRETVKICGPVGQAALWPLVMRQRLVTGALGTAMRMITGGRR